MLGGLVTLKIFTLKIVEDSFLGPPPPKDLPIYTKWNYSTFSVLLCWILNPNLHMQGKCSVAEMHSWANILLNS